MIVRRLTALPVEAVVRGYLIGSRLEGLPAHRRGVRHRASRGAQAGRPAARADLHAVDQGRARPARRERGLRARRGADRRRARRAGARHRDRAVPVRRRARPGARHHHRGYEVRVRHRRDGSADPDRRGADTGFIAVLAGRYLSSRDQPAVLRQAIRSRLSRNARLGQASARASSAGRRDPAHRREIPGGAAPADRRRSDRSALRRPPCGDDAMQLAHAIGERRWPGLQDDR